MELQHTVITENTILQLPAVALRGLVVMPGESVSFDIGREKSYNAVKAAIKANRQIFLVAQRDIDEDEPDFDDLYKIGTLCSIERMLKLPDHTCRLLVHGIQRGQLKHCDFQNYLLATFVPVSDDVPECEIGYTDALCQLVRNDYDRLVNLSTKPMPKVNLSEREKNNPSIVSDHFAALVPIGYEEKQEVLEQTDPIRRLELVRDILEKEYQIGLLENKIGDKTRAFIDQNQREYYLREQIHAINTELYGDSDPDEETNRYYEKIEQLSAPDEIKNLLNDEVKKLANMPIGAHEATVVRLYLDSCLKLPWGIMTEEKTDIQAAADILDRDHYGLKKVKERILESLAVLALNPNAKGNIICLAGPPGVGKTSIARSLAECMGRNFERISLGGIGDEAEIRGHRKTYIGAMPGKIIKAITNAKSNNPLILLDEIDKLSKDYKGDPASALLEVLDSEQNNTFTDHFIDFPYDISNVFFVTTANNVSEIPAPLLDRMDIIELSGYTREDKFQIATRHLYQKQLEKHGLSAKQLSISKKVFYDIADYYTREAGVRNMERKIAQICRKAAKMVVAGQTNKITVNSKNLPEFLGPRKYLPDSLFKKDEVGLVNGLAWTAVGGELMQLEAVALSGSGKIELTGSLGDVMKESAVAAVSYVRSTAKKYGIDAMFYKDNDIHIHATEAAVPKDGPSAGVTMVTAVVSALANIPVRRDVAMTGEVSVRGRVLPIGGLAEKSMAAYRAGVNTVIIPKDNLPDLEEIDPIVREHIQFVPVENVSEVLKIALNQ